MLSKISGEVKNQISNAIRGSVRPSYNALIVVSFIVGECIKQNRSFSEVFDGLSPAIQNEYNYIFRSMEKLNDEIIEQLRNKNFKYIDYFNFILEEESNEGINELSTPESIVDLSTRILDVKNKSSVLDICCGIGSFISKLALNNKSSIYVGNDINPSLKAILEIKKEILINEYKVDISFDNKNAFDLDSDNKSDYIFANYPFNLRKYDYMYEEYIKEIEKNTGKLQRGISVDWLFNFKVMDLLQKNGKAICIMARGALYVQNDKTARQYFVDNNYIESIIYLPTNLFMSTQIPTVLLVLSNNKKDNNVRIIDASNKYVRGFRKNSFASENIDDILNLLKSTDNNDNAKTITNEDLVALDYDFSPNLIFDKKLKFKHSIKFGEVIKEIGRAAQLNSSALDKNISDVPTKYQYCRLSDIEDNMLKSDLPYLTDIDQKNEKYCLKDGDMILSKISKPYKVALVLLDDDTKILANGNFYIIRLDEDKVEPYYIKALFTSDLGQEILQRISKGTVISNISVKDLKELEIPFPSLNEQQKIADKYERNEEEIRVLQLKIKKLKEQNYNNYDFNELEGE